MLSFLAISAVGAIFYSQKWRNSKFRTILACFVISLPDVTTLYTFSDIQQQGICVTAKFIPVGIAQQLLWQLNECCTVPCSMHWTNPWTFHKRQLEVQYKHNTTNTNTTNQHDLLCLFHLHHVHSIYNGLHIHIKKKKKKPDSWYLSTCHKPRLIPFSPAICQYTLYSKKSNMTSTS